MPDVTFKARNILAFPFIVDNASIIRSTGATIDWETMQAGAATTYAEYLDDETNLMVIPAGTIMKAQSGKPQAWVPVAADVDISTISEEWGVIESDAYENDMNDAKNTYGIMKGAYLYENLLPDYVAGRTALTASIDGKKQFMLATYIDSRAA